MYWRWIVNLSSYDRPKLNQELHNQPSKHKVALNNNHFGEIGGRTKVSARLAFWPYDLYANNGNRRTEHPYKINRWHESPYTINLWGNEVSQKTFIYLSFDWGSIVWRFIIFSICHSHVSQIPQSSQGSLSDIPRHTIHPTLGIPLGLKTYYTHQLFIKLFESS